MDNRQLGLTIESASDVDIKEELVESSEENEGLWDVDTNHSAQESADKRQSISDERLNCSDQESDQMDEGELKPPETIFLQMRDETEEDMLVDETDPLGQNDENSVDIVAVERQMRDDGLPFVQQCIEPEEVVAIYVMLRMLKRRRKRRKIKFWLQPAVCSRYECGSYHFIFDDLVNSSEKFFNYFRMSLSTFNELYGLLEGSLQFQNTTMRCAISAKDRLVVTLRYLASGCTLTELHNTFRIGVSTLSYIVKDTCDQIWNILQPTVLPVPTEEKWKEIAKLFWKRGNFPNCFGAIDGKCFQIVPPNCCESYKNKCVSVVLLAVCDTDYCFTLIDIGKYDSDVFKQSSISKLISSNSLNLPLPCSLPSTLSPDFPFVMVGDQAFPLSKNVMCPYGETNFSKKEKVFNYRLTRAQRFIESTFGIFSNKWHIVHRPFNVREELAIDIIKACVILHNFVRMRDGFLFEDTLTQVGLADFDVNNSHKSNDGANIRENLAEYFVGIGSVPWQISKI